MATVSRPPRPSGPPTSALPAIPRTRSSPNSPPSQQSTTTQTPQKRSLRTPSSTLTLPKTRTPIVNKMATADTNNKTPIPTKQIRKQISIDSFPQPPTNTRISSMPTTPMTGSTTPLSAISERMSLKPRSISASNITSTPKSTLAHKKSTLAKPRTPTGLSSVTTDGNYTSRGPGTRESDGLLSLPSPSASRSSSARDSYSTLATNYDEHTDAARVLVNDGSDDVHNVEAKGNVLVSVRVRPDASGANERKTIDSDWKIDGSQSLVSYTGRESGDYYYDNVFSTHDDNARVYDSLAKRLVRRVMEGYHGTVFAYGMTGTGKTFSMQGTTTSPGVIPLAITDIFSYIRETPSREFLLRVSYLEIYNEKIHDLLSESSGGVAGEEIKLREDAKRGVYATPLKEEIVQSPTQLLRVIARGDHARRTSSTQFNARSSRSHAVVQIVVESRERGPGGTAADKRAGTAIGGVRVSTLSLIDLAGSERAAENKERRTEGSHINKSLLTLGTVIARLSGDKDKDGKPTDKDGKHLPYRDSKLTRLLQGALSGDSLVSILCTIQTSSGSAAQSSTHTNETLNTLKFASRAKNNIVSHAKKAEEALGPGGEGAARVLLERYRLEIQELRAQIDNKTKEPDDEEKQLEKEAEVRREEQILEMQLARTALKERIEHLNRLILSSQSIGVNGTYSSMSMYPRFSRQSTYSSRFSVAKSEVSTKHPLDRSASLISTSTLSRLSTPKRQSGEPHTSDSDKSRVRSGEFNDGTASLQQQNEALQYDLLDRNRYISTLEQRLLHARRSSTSRASTALQRTPSMSSIMVGEDHGVANILKEKDAEIAELRASLAEKDRILHALQTGRKQLDGVSTDSYSATSSPSFQRSSTKAHLEASPTSSKSDADLERLSPTKGLVQLKLLSQSAREKSHERTKTTGKGVVRKNKNVDEMSKMLDEMIQDKVEQGLLVKSVRGSVRVAKRESSFGPVIRFPSARKLSLEAGAAGKMI